MKSNLEKANVDERDATPSRDAKDGNDSVTKVHQGNDNCEQPNETGDGKHADTSRLTVTNYMNIAEDNPSFSLGLTQKEMETMSNLEKANVDERDETPSRDVKDGNDSITKFHLGNDNCEQPNETGDGKLVDSSKAIGANDIEEGERNEQKTNNDITERIDGDSTKNNDEEDTTLEQKIQKSEEGGPSKKSSTRMTIRNISNSSRIKCSPFVKRAIDATKKLTIKEKQMGNFCILMGEEHDHSFFPGCRRWFFYLICVDLKKKHTVIIDNRNAAKSEINIERYGEVPDELTGMLYEFMVMSKQTKYANILKKCKKVTIVVKWGNLHSLHSGIYLMRHMETFMGEVANWNSGIAQRSLKQIRLLRIRYCATIVNFKKNALGETMAFQSEYHYQSKSKEEKDALENLLLVLY